MLIRVLGIIGILILAYGVIDQHIRMLRLKRRLQDFER